MLEKLRIIFTIPELRQKILLTLGLLAIYRVGWQVPLPIIDPDAMAAFGKEAGGFADILKTVAYRVYSLIFFRPASPSLVSFSSGGHTVPSS